MPAFITHDLFGRQLLQQMQNCAPAQPTQLSFRNSRIVAWQTAPLSNTTAAFLLGNQGPDPLFFALFTPQMVALKRLGNALHNQHIPETFSAMRDYCLQAPASKQPILQAYLAGYLGHYSLDSVAHPFIYAQQNAFCAAGVPGLDERDGSVVHGQIESDLDAMMLYRCSGKTIREYQPYKEILCIDNRVLAIISTLYQSLAQQIFGLRIAPEAFSRSVADMRLTLHAFYSPRGIKRTFLGRAERLFRRHSLVQAMSTRSSVGLTCDFDNHERQPWRNPFTEQSSDDGFVELFSRAQSQAVARLQALSDNASVEELYSGLNFEGAPNQRRV